MRCEFGVLGPVEARVDEKRLPAGSGRERFVLAALLLDAGRLTPASRLVDTLWDRPPPTARTQLHTMISNWRRRLGADGHRLIVTRPQGYELRLAGHRLDLVEFRQLVDAGKRAARAGDHRRAVVDLTAALSLWRGPALADVADELATDSRHQLHQEKLAAAELLFGSQLELAGHDDVLGALPELIAEHPHRERLYELEMLALAAAGRRSDALRSYERARRRLVDDLGIEPGWALADLQRRILDGDRPAAAPPEPVVPRQLPATIATLAGRDGLVAELGAELGRDGRIAPPVVVLVGPGGVGKTALALRVAHELADRFPDGQLYADLGAGRSRPADPARVAARFLRALGVDGDDIPEDREEWIALYRSLLAGRRVLVVLDDAAGEEQLRPLLPGTSTCATLITSRHRLGALVDATSRTVPVLSPADSLGLLADLVGGRVAAEPEAAAAITRACGHLPLAVSIAAARISARPTWTLDGFARRLTDERGRLDELVIGDLDVRASMALSYRALTPELRLVFRRLGLIGAPDWPAWVVEPLSGRPARLLDRLLDAHLVEPRGHDAAGQDRFRLHDLVADFARERADAQDGPAQRAAAETRLLRTWLALATEADERCGHGREFTAGLAEQAASSAPATPIALPVGDGAAAGQAATAWFEAERVALVAAVDRAGRLGDTDLAGRLALRLAGFLSVRTYHDDRRRTLDDAVRRCRGRVDDRLLACLLDALFVVLADRSQDTLLPAVATELVDLARRLGDARLELRALAHATLAARRLGRLGEAVDRFDEAVALCDTGVRPREHIKILVSGAQIHLERGDTGPALVLSERAVTMAGPAVPRGITALYLAIHGSILVEAGRTDEAEAAYAEAMRTTRELGIDEGTAAIEHDLARIDIGCGHWPVAEVRLDRALRFQEANGDLGDIAAVLRSIGDLAIHRGRPADALAPLRRSVALWRQIRSPLELARSLARLAMACTAIDDRPAAAEHRQEYRAILTDLALDHACLRLRPLP